MTNDDRYELDRILDTALVSYCAQQPRPGIEQRVIAGLFGTKQHESWVRWLIPVPVLAGVLAIVAYWPDAEPTRVKVPQRVVQGTARAEPDAHLPVPVQAKAVVSRKRRAMQPVVEKAAVFPMPSPLTAEERALMRLAASNPDVLQNVQVWQQQRNQPLTVEPIKIAPLEKSDLMED
jgi:hypothetical protein